MDPPSFIEALLIDWRNAALRYDAGARLLANSLHSALRRIFDRNDLVGQINIISTV